MAGKSIMRGWRFGVAVVAAGAAAPAVWAQGLCPTAADLGRGITVTYDDGSTELFRATDRPGVVSMRGRWDDGSGYEVELGQGIHVLWSRPLGPDGTPDESQRIAYDYGLAPEALPVPVAGGRFDVASVSTTVSGTQPEPQSQAYGAIETLALGPCTYDVIPVAIAYDSSLNYWEELSYLPAIGIGLLRMTSENGATLTRLTPVGIRAGK